MKLIEKEIQVHQLGIQFELLTPTIGNDHPLNFLSGKTGRYRMSAREINIYDPFTQHGRFYMYAALDHINRLKLSIRTRSIDQEGKETRHDDFFASEFVEFAFQYFEKNIGINKFVGKWSSTSDNFKIFREKIAETENTIEAAKMTWSGKIMVKHGLSNVAIDDTNPDIVYAFFSRP